MLRSAFRRSQGYSLLEVLLTVSLLGLLLFAVGDAISHVLDATVLGEGRAHVSGSADELAARLADEARSSTAVFVPGQDVYGQPNGSQAGGHEVDFYRKASDGSSSFVAYRLDAQTGVVTRFDYVPASIGMPQIIHQDQMAQGISAFVAARSSPQSITGVVGPSSVKPVNIYYGSAGLAGGNGIVTVAIDAGPTGGPQRRTELHLSSRAAPTDVSVYVSGSPPPSPSASPSPVTVAFVLMSSKIVPPHGPGRQGNPGGTEPTRPGLPGVAVFMGSGPDVNADWLSFYNTYAVARDGIYSFRDSNGNVETAVISCDGGQCPPFVPKPEPTTGSALLFYTNT